MKIVIFFTISYIFLFSNVDSFIDNFESNYEKKEMNSNIFNKKIVTEKKVFRKKITPKRITPKRITPKKITPMMNEATSINNAIKNQQYYNNKDNILKAIDMSIEEYVDNLIPLIIVFGLFIFLFFIMYLMISTMKFSKLTHRVNVLENLLSPKLKDLAHKEDEDYDNIKQKNLKTTSLESVDRKKFDNDKKLSSTEKVNDIHSPRTINTNQDDFLLDDDFAMDNEDEELIFHDNRGKKKQEKAPNNNIEKKKAPNNNIERKKEQKIAPNNNIEKKEQKIAPNNNIEKKEQEIAPITDLTNLDMDIKTPTKKTQKTNIDSMEDFSLDDFDE